MKKTKIAWVSLTITVFSACSLERAPNTSTVSLDFSRMHLRKTRHSIFPDTSYTGQFDHMSQLLLGAFADRSVAAPTTIGGFSCFGVNVTGFGIPTTNGNFDTSNPDDPDCTYPGVSSALVSASGTGASIEVPIPSGPNRLIQVVGLQSTTGCPAGALTDHIFDSTTTGAYELGRASSDIYQESSVSIKSKFTPSNLKKPFTCQSAQLYLYVINDNGGGGVHGTLQGFKINRLNGVLTQVPGATKTTQGYVSSWASIAVSNAGKWLYVATDDDGSGNAEVEAYAIDAKTGNLTLTTHASLGADSEAVAVAVDPYDEFLFVGYQDSVASFAINQTTGGFSATPQQTIGGAPYVSGFAIGPDGNSLYTANLSDLSGYQIGTTATPLAALSPPTFSIDAASDSPVSLAISPEGGGVYTANSGGDQGISQFSVNDDNTLSLIDGPADSGTEYPKVFVDPYYGSTLYGADTTEDGVVAFPIQDDGSLGTYIDFKAVLNPAQVNTMNDIAIDPWSKYVFAAYQTGHLASFGLNGDGTFSSTEQLFTITGATGPAAIAIALIRQ